MHLLLVDTWSAAEREKSMQKNYSHSQHWQKKPFAFLAAEDTKCAVRSEDTDDGMVDRDRDVNGRVDGESDADVEQRNFLTIARVVANVIRQNVESGPLEKGVFGEDVAMGVCENQHRETELALEQ